MVSYGSNPRTMIAMFRLACLLIGGMIMLPGPATGDVRVHSEPPGAQVWVSPLFDPSVRFVGSAPVAVDVGAEERLQVICRLPGHFPVFEEISAAEREVCVTLTPLPADPRDLVAIGWRENLLGPWIGPMGRADEAWRVAPATPDTCSSSRGYTWSPYGRYVAWDRCATLHAGTHLDVVARLLLVDTATGDCRELFRSPVFAGEGIYAHRCDVAWSPDGEYLVYTHPPYRRLLVFRPTDNTERVLVDGPERFIRSPTVTADGRVWWWRDTSSLRVCDWDGGGHEQVEIEGFRTVILRDGTLLSEAKGELFAYAAGQWEPVGTLDADTDDWSGLDFLVSPDGMGVLMVRQWYWDDESPETTRRPPVYVWTRDAGLRQVTEGVYPEALWAPDGQSVLLRSADFIHERWRQFGLAGERLWSVDEPVALFLLGWLRWSRSGTWLATTEPPDEGAPGRLWLARSDGSQSRLVQLKQRLVLAFDWGPEQQIALIAGKEYGDPSHLYVVEGPGAEPQLLRTGSYREACSWSPDGRQIAVVERSEATGGRIVVVDPATGMARALTDWGRWSGVSWHPSRPDLLAFSVSQPVSAHTDHTQYGLIDSSGAVLATWERVWVDGDPPRWTPDGLLRVGFHLHAVVDEDGAEHPSRWPLYVNPVGYADCSWDGEYVAIAEDGTIRIYDWEALRPPVTQDMAYLRSGAEPVRRVVPGSEWLKGPVAPLPWAELRRE